MRVTYMVAVCVKVGAVVQAGGVPEGGGLRKPWQGVGFLALAKIKKKKFFFVKLQRNEGADRFRDVF